MRRLLVATQRIDPGHPALAATVPMLDALARRVEELVVLCDTAVAGAAPPGVRVRTFGASAQLGRGARFEAALAREVARGRAPVLAHMIPRYAVLAAPLTRPLGSRLLLWYTHWNATRELRLATRLCTDALSADAASFPLRTDKLRATGHAIDVGRFRLPRTGGRRLRIAALGRMSPMKRYPTLVAAVRQLLAEGVDVELEIRGPSLTEEERAHRHALERLVRDAGLDGRVAVGDPVPWAEIPALLARTDVLANLAEAADKIVYEAAAAGAVVAASAPAFAGLLPEELRFARDDAVALAAVLRRVAAMPPDGREALGALLRQRVAEGHSVEHWAERVVAIASQSP